MEQRASLIDWLVTLPNGLKLFPNASTEVNTNESVYNFKLAD